MRALISCALLACAPPASSFDLFVTGDLQAPIRSSARATGEIDNAGFLVVDDETWSLGMQLGDIAPGQHAVTPKNGEVSLLRKSNGAYFTTTLGGTCSVKIGPHSNTNGDSVTGTFFCDGLRSSSGGTISITSGAFHTFINDHANDPKLRNPPTP